MNKFLRYLFVALMAMVMGNVYADDVTDVMTWESLGLDGTSNSYKDFSGIKLTSNAVYAAQASSGTAQYIQLRSNNNNSGIVTTASGGKLKSVTITFNSKTTDRKVQVYGKNEAYTAPTDLYDAATQGTLLKEIAANDESKTLTVEGDYAFVGLRSASGALYVDKIEVTWASDGGSGSQEAGNVWDFTVLPTQAIDGTGNIETNVEGGILPEDGGESWSAFYNKDAIDGAEFMNKAGETLELTKGLKWYINGAKKVYYRNYPVESGGKPYGGKYIFINDGDNSVEICVPAEVGQQIEIIASTAKNNKKITSQDVAETFETTEGETLHGVVIDGTTNYDWKPYTLTVTAKNPFLKFEKNACIQKITVKDATGISVAKSNVKVNNGVIYNLAGQKVGKDYKGIVIMNGKKMIQK